MISATLRVPLYNILVKVVLVNDIGRYYNSFEQRGIEIKNTDDFHRTASVVIDLSEYDEEHPFELVILKGMEDNGGNYVHELFHLTTGIMRYIGDTLGENNEESYAYLQQYLYNKVKLIVKDLRNKEDE